MPWKSAAEEAKIGVVRPRRIPPGPGQESVWDYPRPPRIERTSKRIRVVVAGTVVADTRRGHRVLETSHPPVYYVPLADIDARCLRDAPGTSFCEWKGVARYHDVVVGDVLRARAAWSYPAPSAAFLAITSAVAFYAGLMDECTVDDERVRPQPGGFYGGWITPGVVGAFKGEPGTGDW